jgi:excisionase family DNA binding protein
MADSPQVFDIHEAAAFLGAHEQTIRRLARRGAIPCFKVGRDWRFRREALVKWSEAQPSGAATCSVLIIDDEERVCRMMGKILERIGCVVRQTTRAKEGLELVREDAPDVILLDLVMPDMNGPRFLAELRKTHPELPVVTGYPDSELMAQASQYAPVMMLAKPVERELLERTVRVVTGETTTSVAGGGVR